MTGSEYQDWLATLDPAARAAVEHATRVLTDMLVHLEQQMDIVRQQMKDHETRITRLERYLGMPERNINHDDRS